MDIVVGEITIKVPVRKPKLPNDPVVADAKSQSDAPKVDATECGAEQTDAVVWPEPPIISPPNVLSNVDQLPSQATSATATARSSSTISPATMKGSSTTRFQARSSHSRPPAVRRVKGGQSASTSPAQSMKTGNTAKSQASSYGSNASSSSVDRRGRAKVQPGNGKAAPSPRQPIPPPPKQRYQAPSTVPIIVMPPTARPFSPGPGEFVEDDDTASVTQSTISMLGNAIATSS